MSDDGEIRKQLSDQGLSVKQIDEALDMIWRQLQEEEGGVSLFDLEKTSFYLGDAGDGEAICKKGLRSQIKNGQAGFRYIVPHVKSCDAHRNQ